MLEAELSRSLEALRIEVEPVQLSYVVASFTELEPQPEALEAFQILSEADWKLIALTNGSENSTRKLLERASALQHFASILSCDTIQKTKPHPDVYARPSGTLKETYG